MLSFICIRFSVSPTKDRTNDQLNIADIFFQKKNIVDIKNSFWKNIVDICVHYKPNLCMLAFVIFIINLAIKISKKILIWGGSFTI